MRQNKSTRKKYPLGLLFGSVFFSVTYVFLLPVLGYFAANLPAALVLLFAGIFGMLATALLNLLRDRKSRVQKESAEEIYAELEAKRTSLLADIRTARRGFRLAVLKAYLQTFAILLSAALFVTGLCAVIFLCIPDVAAAAILAILVAVAVFFLLVYEHVMMLPRPVDFTQEPSPELSPSDYPTLYAVANIGIADMSGAEVRLSPLLVRLLTEEELYTVLLHEFAHALHRDTVWLARATTLVHRLAYPALRGLYAKVHELFYTSFAAECSFELNFYLTYASLSRELLADEAVKDAGEGENYLNALFKCALLDEFLRIPRKELGADYYISDKPRQDFFRTRYDLFEKVMPAEYAHAREVIFRTLPSKSDTHPTFSMRRKAFGGGDPDPARRPAGTYADEAKRYLDDCGTRMIADLGSYSDNTGRFYRTAVDEIAKYDEALAQGETPSALLEHRTLFYLYDTDMVRAKELAEALYARDGRLDAQFVLGTALCLEDDERGPELLREVLLENISYSAAMNILADAVLRSGDEEKLEALRKDTILFTSVQLEEAKRRSEFAKRLKKAPHVAISPCSLEKDRLAELRGPWRMRTSTPLTAENSR